MVRFLKHTLFSIFFLAGLAALLVLFTEITLPKNNTKEAGIDEISMMGIFAEPENSIDVLYMGDSTIYTGIIPLEIWRNTGIPSYAVSTPLQYLHYTNDLLEQIYQTQSPRYLFIDTGTVFYQQSPLWLSKYYPTKYLKVFRYHDNWKVLDFNSMFAPVNYTHIERDKGHVISTQIMPATQAATDRYRSPSDAKATFPIGNQACFEKLLNQCKQHNTEPILISVPSLYTWGMRKHNGAQAIADYYGIRYLDLNMLPDELQIDWALDTADAGEHLNDVGALKVSEYISRYMRDNLDLSDHRDNPAYAPWNAALDDYDAQISDETDAQMNA